MPSTRCAACHVWQADSLCLLSVCKLSTTAEGKSLPDWCCRANTVCPLLAHTLGPQRRFQRTYTQIQ